jgi:hypothetical protein
MGAMGEFYFVTNITYQKNERLYVAINPDIVLNEILHGVKKQKQKLLQLVIIFNLLSQIKPLIDYQKF